MTTDPGRNIRDSITYTRSRYGVSAEALKYQRRRGPDKTYEPTRHDWQVYHRAVEAIGAADKNPFIYIDINGIEPPCPYREPGDYIETEKEWIVRVADLLAESDGELPDDLDLALSVGETVKLKYVLGLGGSQ